MAKLKLSLNQISGVDVQYISLVEKAASRLPFRVTKSDESNEEGNMKNTSFAGLDLTRIFRRKDDAAQIVGVVTTKGESLESVKATIVQSGLSVGDMIDNGDGTLLFKQDGADAALGSPVIVRMSDDMALVMKGFSSYNIEVGDGSSFADLCAAQGFYPGLYAFTETLGDTIRSAMWDADTPAEASRAVGKIVDEAKAYIQSLIAVLPEKAFKMETALAQVSKDDAKDEAKDSAAETTGTTDEVVAEAGAGTEAVVETTDTAVAEEVVVVEGATAEGEVDGADVVGDTADNAEAETAAEQEAVVKSDPGQDIAAAIAAALAPMTQSLAEWASKQEASIKALQDSVTAGMATVTSSVSAAVAKADEAQNSSAAAQATLKAVVVSPVVDLDPVPETPVQKHEPLGDIDTAFMSGRRGRR